MNAVRRAALGALLVMLCGCSPYELPPASRYVLPERLSELGAYTDLRAGTVAESLRPYRPSFALWSDGAAKRRWIRLPAGTQIDTADADSWRFPVGTELWKEFAVNGRRIETRVLKKITDADDGWAATTYAWSSSQDDAVVLKDGAVDVLGTKYDIPSARSCMACHGGRAERVLGFSAVQLAHDARQPGEVTLDSLVAENRLTRAPSMPIRVPGTSEDAAALGYLHANCGHCHNRERPSDATYFKPPSNVAFGLRTQDLGAVTSTEAYATAVRFAMGINPVDRHLVLQRMTRQGAYMQRMPPIATKRIDPDGVASVRGWLERWTAPKNR